MIALPKKIRGSFEVGDEVEISFVYDYDRFQILSSVKTTTAITNPASWLIDRDEEFMGNFIWAFGLSLKCGAPFLSLQMMMSVNSKSLPIPHPKALLMASLAHQKEA